MKDPQNEPITQAKLHWYRIPLDRALLAELNQRSDAWGFAQTLGHLGVIIATGTLSWYASHHWSWFVLAAADWKTIGNASSSQSTNRQGAASCSPGRACCLSVTR